MLSHQYHSRIGVVIMKIKRKTALILGILLLLVGLVNLAYYPLSIYMSNKVHLQNIHDYDFSVSQLPVDEYDIMLQDAHEYNADLYERSSQIGFLDEDQEEVYNSMLDVSETGRFGYIEIPKINLSEPIYHGTSNEVLTKGIGHLSGSSLPVGGENTRSILTGHSGLTNAVLFTRLNQLKVGDVFMITVLKETVTYEVYDIQELLPLEANDLPIFEGEDVCTLVTCSPYGINSHRLLVTGRRIPNIENVEDIPIIPKDGTEELDFGVKLIIRNLLIEVAGILLFIFILGRKVVFDDTDESKESKEVDEIEEVDVMSQEAGTNEEVKND